MKTADHRFRQIVIQSAPWIWARPTNDSYFADAPLVVGCSICGRERSAPELDDLISFRDDHGSCRARRDVEDHLRRRRREAGEDPRDTWRWLRAHARAGTALGLSRQRTYPAGPGGQHHAALALRGAHLLWGE